MANSEAPAPTPEPEGGPPPAPGPQGGAAPQRRISGLLIFSLIMSLAGYLPMVGIQFPLPPVIGPLAGLLLALYGLRGVRRDPLIVGPMLGKVCLVVGFLSLAVQSYLSYKVWPAIQMNASQNQALIGFLDPMKERKWQEAYDSLDESFQSQQTFEEFEAMLSGAFPGEESIAWSPETVRYPILDDPEALQEFSRRSKEYFESEQKVFTQEYQMVIPHQDGEVDLTFWLRSERSGFADFKTKLTSLTVLRLPTDGAGDADVEEDPGQDATEDPIKDGD